jgi:hypothetical protein
LIVGGRVAVTPRLVRPLREGGIMGKVPMRIAMVGHLLYLVVVSALVFVIV